MNLNQLIKQLQYIRANLDNDSLIAPDPIVSFNVKDFTRKYDINLYLDENNLVETSNNFEVVLNLADY